MFGSTSRPHAEKTMLFREDAQSVRLGEGTGKRGVRSVTDRAGRVSFTHWQHCDYTKAGQDLPLQLVEVELGFPPCSTLISINN